MVQQQLGVPPALVLQTLVATEPPPLPVHHISRAAEFSGLAREFDTHAAVAVIGYPESGKTVAIAEFAAAFPGEVFWFSVAPSETHPDGWFGLLCYALASYLNCQSISIVEIRAALVNRAKPICVVIDNCQYCHNIDALDFLLEAASAGNALNVLLVGTDAPVFVTGLRTRGIPEWRLPGLSETSATQLFTLLGGALSASQWSALELLRLRVDGHAGMLKLSHARIRQIDSPENLRIFERDIVLGIGGSVEALQSSMTDRLRSSLNADDIELCRRLSLAIRPFRRGVGEALWGLDRPSESFTAPWINCSIGVFEYRPMGRYALPDIYRDEFRRELGDEQRQLFHQAIADALADKAEKTLDVFDVEAEVIHRLLSGGVAEAIHAASMYLAMASGPHAAKIQSFLIERFSIWLDKSLDDGGVDVSARLRWFAISARTYRDLGKLDEADEAATKLHKLLALHTACEDTHSVQLGWMVILMHGSQAGRPGWAEEAANHIKPPEIPHAKSLPLPWLEYSVMAAYLNAESNPLPYLERVLDRWSSSPDRPWRSKHSYAYWRGVMICAYSAISTASRDRPTEIASAIELLTTIIGKARGLSQFELASLLQALLVHIHIDLARDFQSACDAGREMVALAQHVDPRLAAYVRDTYGDALRCAGDHKAAILEYQTALKLWPASESYDRAESLLMLGISHARTEDFAEGRRACLRAAELYERAGTHGWEPASARCLLEGACGCVHASRYTAAIRCLVRAHRLLKDEHRDRSEWAALGQIAWSIASRLEPDPVNPQPPVPGFTLGLQETLPEAANMHASAPTLMLARACNAVGLPHRALSYFEVAVQESKGSSEEKTQVGLLAIDAAIKAELLAEASKYAAWASNCMERTLLDAPPGFDVFFLDYQVGRVVRLASVADDATVATSQLEAALAAISFAGTDNAAVRLLQCTLQAYLASVAENSDAALEQAFGKAIAAKGIWIAREIAWYWCYRHAPRSPSYEANHLRWHWRLCWLTLEMASNDSTFLSGVAEQEKKFWLYFAETTSDETHARIAKAFSSNNSTPQEVIAAAIGEIATLAAKKLNASDVSNEFSSQLRLSNDAHGVARPLAAFVIRMIDLVLLPGAPQKLLALRADISTVVSALSAHQANSLIESRRRLTGLLALLDALESGQPTAESFKGLVDCRDVVPHLSDSSAAQFYIWLRHFAEMSRDEIFSYAETCNLLSSAHVTALLQGDSLLPHLRIRLATCREAANSFFAHQSLTQSLSTVATQSSMRGPIRRSALEAANASVEKSLADLRKVIETLDEIEASAESLSLRQEVWSCCMERGGTRRLTGSAFIIFTGDDSALVDWLIPAIADFRQAVTSVGPVTSHDSASQTLKAAFSGLGVARIAQDEAAISEFSAVIDEIRSLGIYNEELAAQELLEANDPLNRGDEGSDRPFLMPDDEAGIQAYVDHMMASTGWPEDRRVFVEVDVRNMARTEEVQRNYCQYLQPLQNLEHLQSPRTVYTEKTRHVASCTLLGYETQIEVDEIDVAFNAMKRVHCETCTHRLPRGTPPSR